MPSVQEQKNWLLALDGVIERAPESISFRTAEALYTAGAIEFRFDTPVRHVSGIEAPIYVDVKKAFGDPVARSSISSLLAEYARHQSSLVFDVVVGVPSGGQAPAQELANQLFMPYAYVRDKPKEHGMQKVVEGADVEGKRSLVVEDVVNLGTSSLPRVDVLRSVGSTVTDVLAVVTYGYTKTKEQFAEAGLKLHTLTTVPDIVEVGVLRGAVSREDADRVLAWLREQDQNNVKIP
jgi:orotate phosphoribosyltransferase